MVAGCVINWGEAVDVFVAINKEFDAKVRLKDVTVWGIGEGGA